MNAVPENAQQAHPAAVAQEFMKRSDMKGGEVEAYAQTFNWLAQFLSGDLLATPKEAHLAMVEELKELRDFKRGCNEEDSKVEAEESGELPVLMPYFTPEELDPVDSETSEQL